MSAKNWEIEALTRFPDLADRHFQNVDSPGMLWIELQIAFERAYGEPRNDDLISRIYGFADWCIAQEDEPELDFHLGTIVCTHFYEHIPELKAAREDMPRWFTRDDVVGTKEVFSYIVGEVGFMEILRVYDASSEHAKTTR